MIPVALKIVIAVVLAGHGIGHVIGLTAVWGIAGFGAVSARSWLLTGNLGESSARALGGALWLIPTLGFLAVAVGSFTGQAWWRSLAAGSAVASLMALTLFFGALPAGSRIGCIIVDVAVIVAVALAPAPLGSVVRS